MKFSQMTGLKITDMTNQPSVKIEDMARTFLRLFCLTLPSLPKIEFNNPNKIMSLIISFFMDSKINGINFCQIERTQKCFHESF
jgi:hypothetical protein